MSLLVPDVGEVKLLKLALGVDAQENQTLKLFVNDKTPAEADTAVSYTEMSSQGYASKTLVKANWSVSTLVGVTTASYAEQEFIFNGVGGPVSVYGYYIVGATSGELLWAERFADGPDVLTDVNGAIIRVVPKLTGA